MNWGDLGRLYVTGCFFILLTILTVGAIVGSIAWATEKVAWLLR